MEIRQKGHYDGLAIYGKGSEEQSQTLQWVFTAHFSHLLFKKLKAQIGTRRVPGLVAQLGSKPRYPDLWSSFLSKTIRVGKMRDIHSHPLGSLRDVGICRGILEVWGQCPNFWLWNISRRPRTSLAHTADLQGKREVERSLDAERNRQAPKRETWCDTDEPRAHRVPTLTLTRFVVLHGFLLKVLKYIQPELLLQAITVVSKKALQTISVGEHKSVKSGQFLYL